MRRVTKLLFWVTGLAILAYLILILRHHQVATRLRVQFEKGAKGAFDLQQALRLFHGTEGEDGTESVNPPNPAAPSTHASGGRSGVGSVKSAGPESKKDETPAVKEKTAVLTNKTVARTEKTVKNTTVIKKTEKSQVQKSQNANKSSPGSKKPLDQTKVAPPLNQTRVASPLNQTKVTSPLNQTKVTSPLNQTKVTSSGKKYVIFVCDNRRSCGGWGDRQRALTSVYILANVTNRTFGMILTRPCNVSNFYLPNKVNWNIPEKELAGKSNISLDDMDSRLKMTGRLTKMDFNQEYPQDVVYIRTNGEYYLGLFQNKLYAHNIPQQFRSRQKYFYTVWNILMKPAPAIQKRLDDFLARAGYAGRKQPFVCGHVRVGRSTTFRDSEYRTRPSELPALWDFFTSYIQNGSKVFLATDSVEVRNISYARFGDKVLTTGEKIVHVDRRGSDACDGLGTALLEQLILSKCDVIVLTNSGFSYRAALMRSTQENVYRLSKGKITKITV